MGWGAKRSQGRGRERRVKRGMGEEKVIGRQDKDGKAGKKKRARSYREGVREEWLLITSCL